LVYVVRAQEGIHIVLDQFSERLAGRVVGGYGYYTHIVLESTLREEIMSAICDSPLAGNYGYSHEYEAPQVTWILSREVFRIQGLLRYIDGDRDNIFLGAIWKEPNRAVDTELIHSTRFPLYDGIPGVWIILTLMVTSVVHQQIKIIRSGGLPIWWWDLRIHLSDILIQMTMIDITMIVIGLLYFLDVGREEVETYSI
jgi:hypothetical protein